MKIPAKAKQILLLSLVFVGAVFIYKSVKKSNLNPNYEVGQAIDSLNHVIVYYNGGVDHVERRNMAGDYNLGLKYQCVEFVKRYYYEYYQHKMPDSYGHAVSFFDESVADGKVNSQRGLIQFTNPSATKPKVGDLVVFDGSLFNKYGHVAIISEVTDNEIEIIQQNPGPFGSSRETYKLNFSNEKWHIEQERLLGWLRMKRSKQD